MNGIDRMTARITELEAERDSLRKALDDRYAADLKAAKAIFAETGRTSGFPPVKEVVAYYMAEVERLRQAYSTENDDVCQTLGKALGYPWFKDDQKNFPGATEDNGVCVGDHVAASIAAEAAKRIDSLRAKFERAKEIALKLIATIDACPRYETAAGGMTIEAQLRRTVINRVPAWDVEEAREAVLSELSDAAPAKDEA